ncbi:hypothetical protein ABZ571_35390, partial [Streptomyces sp. NPDC013130]|uniref:hypothetical protein n=1 Tax=Streptomyces sp. NPDC013130 TaxID=3156695 RepID=UPI0033D8C4FD
AVRDRLGRRHEADHDLASLPWHLERAKRLDLILDEADIADFTVDTTSTAPPDTDAAVARATGCLCRGVHLTHTANASSAGGVPLWVWSS